MNNNSASAHSRLFFIYKHAFPVELTKINVYGPLQNLEVSLSRAKWDETTERMQ